MANVAPSSEYTLLLRPYTNKEGIAIVTGRNVYDLTVDATDGKIRPISEILRQNLHREGVLLVRYCLATEVTYAADALDAADKKALRNLFDELGILRIVDGATEVSGDFNAILKGILRLSTEPRYKTLSWQEGKPLKCCFLFEFPDHLLRNPEQACNQADLIAAEFAVIASYSLSLRASGHYILLADEHGRLADTGIAQNISTINLPMPGREGKAAFIKAALARYPKAAFSEDIDAGIAAHLNANTPNRGLEKMMLRSDLHGAPITANDLFESKAKDVAAMSEGTLQLTDVSGLKLNTLVGRNIEKAVRFFTQQGGMLMRGERTDLNFIMAGRASTGKSSLAKAIAKSAQVPFLEIGNVKGGIVGTTRSKNIAMWNTLATVESMAFSDEITEALPVQDSGSNLDAGATDDVVAEMLKGLADPRREGKNILIGATNAPWKISDRFQSRFTFFPVLGAFSQDYPAIVASLAASIDEHFDVDCVADPLFIEAAGRFYAASVVPRNIARALKNIYRADRKLHPKNILFASKTARPQNFIDQQTSLYCDLYAILVCSDFDFLPWIKITGDDVTTDREVTLDSSILLPEYITKVIDPVTGIPDTQKIQYELKKLESFKNI